MDIASHHHRLQPQAHLYRNRSNIRLLRCLLSLLALALAWPGAAPVAAASGATFEIVWDTGCPAPPADADAALRYAAGLLGAHLSSPVPISVVACWSSSVPAGALATGDAVAYLRNVGGAPLADTFYPVALANALAGQDLLPDTEDVTLNFNASAVWSFATTVPSGSGEDFVTVAMHELVHGLGFNAFMYESYNVGFCGGGPLFVAYHFCPTPYDRLAVDGADTPLLSLLLPDPRVLGARLKGDAYFGGPNARLANGVRSARLYTPAIWDDGSSLVHLDMSFDSSPNGLMTPSIGAALRHPGSLTLAMLRDMGWPLAGIAPALKLDGPVAAPVGQPAALTATLAWPTYTGQAVTYTWSAPGYTEATHRSAALSDPLQLRWDTPGYRIVSAGATVDGSTDYASHSLLVIDVTLEGAATGAVGQTATVTARLQPSDTALPVSYLWQATGQAEQQHAAVGPTDRAQFTWRTPGSITVTVRASVGGADVTATKIIMVEASSVNWQLFLPAVIR